MSLKEAAEEVLAILEAGRYERNGQTIEFGVEQSQAMEGTRLYTPAELAGLGGSREGIPKITVASSTTQEAAFEWTQQEKANVAVLNFASARNPGGGFLNGAKAQEEDLCRCSGLYPCLLRCMEYYEVNRRQSSLLYTDYAIFSPAVPFFRTASRDPFLLKPFYVSVITAPAPNSSPYLADNPTGHDDIERTFLRRWKNVLRIALDQGIERLILGAWGCGAFGGDPQVASRTAKEAIRIEGGGIAEIEFAIPGSGKQSLANLTVFRQTFGL